MLSFDFLVVYYKYLSNVLYAECIYFFFTAFPIILMEVKRIKLFFNSTIEKESKASDEF